MHLTWQPRELGDGPPILTSVDPAEAEELGRLAKGKQVLEIGSAYGYSACIMALAGAEHITAIDPHVTWTWLGDTLPQMRANLDAYGVADRVEIMQGYSYDVMPQLIADERVFDFIFIDGDHLGPAVDQDIVYARQLLAPGGVIACHDYMEHCCCPEVLHAVNRAFNQPTRVIATMSVHES
jgi:predicted O-methyltransferase YrrM